jgi:hypothetical protein
MNIIEFNPGWKTDIAFCCVDNTSTYQSSIREFMKNQADGTLVNIYNKGWTVYQWLDEDVLLRHASNKGHKWAVVFSTGTEFVNGTGFFDAILNLIKQDFFIAGHILDRDDAYYELHHQCYVVNLEVYKQLRYPIIGKQELGVTHTQEEPNRSDDNYHDYYTPKIINRGWGDRTYKHKFHGWNILRVALATDSPIIVFDESIRNNKRHFYPESPKDFNKQLSWAYHRLNYCQSEFIHTSNTEDIHLPVKKYKQIVTPASGIWFNNYLESNTKVVMYDYNDKALAYWKNKCPDYTFVKCDLLGEDNLLDYIDTSIDDTLVHLSNIFNYEATVFFYSLEYRIFKETELLNKIKIAMPNAIVHFNLCANVLDTTPTWHINQ